MTQTPHQAQTGAESQGRPQGSKFWDDITSTGLRRDRSRQWFAGVSSGIARRVDVDPVLIRAAFIALTLFGGFGIVAYLVLWLLMPDDGGRIMARDAIERRDGSDASGAIIISVIVLLVIAAIVFGDNGFLIGWGVIPLAIVGWLFWRHEQGKGSTSAWQSAAGPGGSTEQTASYAGTPYAGTPYAATPHAGTTQAGTSYAASSPAAPAAPPMAPSMGGTGTAWADAPASQGWQPPPAPPVPPRAHLPLAPPPPPRPRRRTAGMAGFALVLGLAVVGYGAGLMLDGPVGFPGSRELFGGVLALGAASLATMIIGLTGRRSILSAILVMILGVGVGTAGIVEGNWEGDRGVRTWTPSISTTTQHFDHSVGRATIDLRPLFASLAAPVPSGGPSATLPDPTVAPQELDIEQGAGEMTIIVPSGASAQIRAKAEFGEVRVVGDLPEGISDRDDGGNDGPSETLSLSVGSGAPDVIVRADITVGQITIQEG
ncbi:PspC domain-containing protein [Knoellia sp. LjRoot47]|uniref:PspC domain-containing protein n=1 Tax=Knoellia sp. LjRoot47 TaxID=3342330 RepID=UPI003ECD851D